MPPEPLLAAVLSAPVVALLPLPVTLPAALIDLRRRILPDALTLALFASGLLVAALADPDPAAPLLRAGEAGLAYGLFRGLRAVHARLRGRIGLGLGDVKFLAGATAWTGLPGLPVVILAASLSALAGLALARVAGRRIGPETRLPFGPFLALGLHAALWLGPA